MVMEAVEGLLAANDKVKPVAKEALAHGFSEAEVKTALGRAFLFCYWYAATEGAYGGDPNQDVADRFKVELKTLKE